MYRKWEILTFSCFNLLRILISRNVRWQYVWCSNGEIFLIATRVSVTLSVAALKTKTHTHRGQLVKAKKHIQPKSSLFTVGTIWRLYWSQLKRCRTNLIITVNLYFLFQLRKWNLQLCQQRNHAEANAIFANLLQD